MRLAAALVMAAMLVGSANAQAPRAATTPATTTATTAPADATTPAGAPGGADTQLPAAVAADQIAVSSDYRGSYVTVIVLNPAGRGDVVVALRGPSAPAVVMRKRRVLGLWVNGEPVHFSAAPSFHAVLSNRALREIASPQAIWALQIDPAASARLGSAVPAGADPSEYRAALVRLRRAQGLYPPPRSMARQSTTREGLAQEGLTLLEGVGYRAVFRLPANAPIAVYNADAYLFRNGRLISSRRIPVQVARIGIERRIHDLALNASVVYGLLTVLLAFGAGWVAAFAFRRG